MEKKQKAIWGLLRLSMGWVFLWAFLDKLFGLGFTTCRDAVSGSAITLCESAWLSGGSPTYGFLNFATKGPFAEFYQSLAGVAATDWLFMMGLLFVGVTLVLGIFVRLGAFVGILMMIIMYTAAFLPPENNPIVDDHIVYALVMAGLMFSRSGKYFGFGRKWSETNLVRKYPILE